MNFSVLYMQFKTCVLT